MKKTKVCLIFGGASSEYAVSLQSAYSVLTSLDKNIYDIINIGISKTGQWFHYEGPYEGVRDDCWLNPKDARPAALLPKTKKIHLYNEDASDLTFDVIFPVLHGKFGEDGTLQGLLDLYALPYVGCGTLASALCMDKHRAHQLIKAHGIGTPKSFLADASTPLEGEHLPIAYPFFVKPLSGGSSLGITRVENESQLKGALSLAFKYDSRLVLEEAIDGFEVGCAILGTKKPILGTVDEIELMSGFFDFETKYQADTAKIHVPARISSKKAEEIQKTALDIYKILGCQGLSRVDLFLTPKGQLVFNEVNTLPGLTKRSRFPKMLEAAGYPLSVVLHKAIQEVLENGH